MGKATNPRPKKATATPKAPKAKLPMTLAEQRARTEASERQAQARRDRIASNQGLAVQGTEIVLDTDGRIVAGQRFDCFSTLLRGRPLEAQAVHWLEETIRTAAGENGNERRPDFIRASVEGAPGQNISADMIEAGETLAAIEENLMPSELRLLFTLMAPDAALENGTSETAANWRQIVQRVTGATTPQRQGERVCVACERLAWIRENITRLLRERQERKKLAA